MKIIEYIKMILEKVSFDKSLFEKELRKGLSQLKKPEIKELKAWCYEKFGQMYKVILEKVFGRFRKVKLA